MAMPAFPKAIFNRSLRLVRAPLDAALGVVSGPGSSANHALDRIEAGARSAIGALFRDEELSQQGRAALLATKERERAASLHEQSELRKPEKHRPKKATATAKRANAKRDKAAELKKLDAKEESIDAKEAAIRAQREAERLKKAASAAKRARKDG